MKLQELQQCYARGEIGKPEFISQALALHNQLFDYVRVTQQSDVREILITPMGLSFVIGDDAVRLHCPPDEGRLVPLEVMNFGPYEPFETQVMDLLTLPARQILDIGASIGWHALRWARRLCAVQVHAFEPLPLPLDYLRRNIHANALAGRVHAWGLGLAAHDGVADFFVSPTHGTNASLRNVAESADAVAMPCQVLTLDTWAAQQGVIPDFIKCDVEGAELLVLQGARQTLERHRPVVLAELLRKWCRPFGHHPDDVLAWMAGLGYECHAVGAQGVRPLAAVGDDTPETHYVFLHPAQHAVARAALQALRSPAP